MYLAVLSGDIVDSTSLGATELDDVMRALETASQEMSQWSPSVCDFTRQSGDGWQVALGAVQFDLRAALFLQAIVRRQGKHLRTRIAIAIDDGTLADDPERDLNSAHGPAFITSGRLLSSLKGHAHLAHAVGGACHAAIALADHISDGWTQAQARALCELLPPNSGTRAEAAKRLGISRPAVDQALWSAGFPAIEAALTSWEDQ